LLSKTEIPSGTESRHLGAGVMGVKHLEAWHQLWITVGGLYAPYAERGRAAAEIYGCPVYDSVEPLLMRGDG
jgi:predicted dehydrogenase